MTEWWVRVSYPIAIDITSIEEVMETLPNFQSLYQNDNENFLRITFRSKAEHLDEAYINAGQQISEVSRFINASPEEIEFLTEKAMIERLGGQEALDKLRAWMERTDQQNGQNTP